MRSFESIQPDGTAVGWDPQKKILVILFLFLSAATAFILVDRIGQRRFDALEGIHRQVQPRGPLDYEERSTIELFQNTSPSVVHVTSIHAPRVMTLDTSEPERGTGTGFVWDIKGHILTNYHVIDGASKLSVTFADQSTHDATIVGAAPHKDLALLQVHVPAAKLRPITIGTSSDLHVGQRVLAIGNPFGLDQTLTTGIVSGLGREIRSITNRPILDVVQTDAAINPGNSGGPLLDSAGRLIGVNTAIYSPTGANDGVGFAIPVDTVRWVMTQLLAHGRVRTPSLGIQAASNEMMERYGLRGVLVMRTEKFGPAARGGVLSFRHDDQGQLIYGDLIVGVDNKPVRDMDDLYAVMDQYDVGDEVELLLIRAPNLPDPETIRLNVRLKSE